MKNFLIVMQKNNISVNWNTVYVGLTTFGLEKQEVFDFAIDYLIKYPDCENQDIIFLAASDENDHIDYVKKLLSRIIQQDSSIQGNLVEQKKWVWSKLTQIYTTCCSINTLSKQEEYLNNAFSCLHGEIDYYEEGPLVDWVSELWLFEFFNCGFGCGCWPGEVSVQMCLSDLKEFLKDQKRQMF